MLLYTLLLLNYIFTTQCCFAQVICTTPENQMGFCIRPKNCKTMTVLLEKQPRPIPPEVKSFLRQFECARFRICCPPNPILFKQVDKNDAQIDFFQFPNVSKHRNFNLLPNNCGKETELKKIVSGEAQLNEFPWMALLLYDTPKGPAFKCGGTILNEKYILTAAHCVTALENYQQSLVLKAVRVGEHDTKTKTDCKPNGAVCAPPVQDLKIEEVVFHSNYNTTSYQNDIALLRVSPIDLTKANIGTVCLPVNGLGNFNYTGRKVVVTGWGFTDDKKEPSSVLQKAAISISPLKECQKTYFENRIALINEGQICAGGGGSDSCGGDSGGPLHSIEVIDGKSKFIQQGIVSFGPCGNAPIPGVYTRVAFYLDWILENIKP